MKFKTSFDVDDVSLDYSNSKVNDYKLCIDDKGHEYLIKIGDHDIDEEIQSYLPDTDINMLIARYLKGDINALNARVGSYGDDVENDLDLNSLYNKFNGALSKLYSNPLFTEFLEKNKDVKVDDFESKFNEFANSKIDELKKKDEVKVNE